MVSVWNCVYNGCAWNGFWCDARCVYYFVLYPPLVSLPLLTVMYVISWHYFCQLVLLHSAIIKKFKLYLYLKNLVIQELNKN